MTTPPDEPRPPAPVLPYYRADPRPMFEVRAPYYAAAPYAAVMVAISAVPTYLLLRRLDALGGGSLT